MNRMTDHPFADSMARRLSGISRRDRCQRSSYFMAGFAALALAAAPPPSAAQQPSQPEYGIWLDLDARTASMIGQREMPLRETLLRQLVVDVKGPEPLRLRLFAASLREGRVATLWWSAPFQVPAGRSRIPGESYLPTGSFVPADRFVEGDEFVGGESVPAGGFVPDAQLIRGDRAIALERPAAGDIPPELQEIARSGTIGEIRVDWKRQAVLYLALVPAEPAVAAASRTRPPAFMIVAPMGD